MRNCQSEKAYYQKDLRSINFASLNTEIFGSKTVMIMSTETCQSLLFLSPRFISGTSVTVISSLQKYLVYLCEIVWKMSLFFLATNFYIPLKNKTKKTNNNKASLCILITKNDQNDACSQIPSKKCFPAWTAELLRGRLWVCMCTRSRTLEPKWTTSTHTCTVFGLGIGNRCCLINTLEFSDFTHAGCC